MTADINDGILPLAERIRGWLTQPLRACRPRVRVMRIDIVDRNHDATATNITFRFNYNWDLPFGRGKAFLHNTPGWLNQVIGNWKWTGNGSEQSGSPIQT